MRTESITPIYNEEPYSKKKKGEKEKGKIPVIIKVWRVGKFLTVQWWNFTTWFSGLDALLPFCQSTVQSVLLCHLMEYCSVCWTKHWNAYSWSYILRWLSHTGASYRVNLAALSLMTARHRGWLFLHWSGLTLSVLTRAARITIDCFLFFKDYQL